MISSAPLSAELESFSFVEVGTTASDNPLLENESSDSQIGLQVKPTLSVKYAGNRFGVNVLGRVNYMRYVGEDEERVDPSLFLRTRGTLIKNLLYLDSNFAFTNRYARNVFLAPTEEKETTAALDNKVFIQKTFGNFADFYTGYSILAVQKLSDEDENEDLADAGDHIRHNVDFTFGRNPNNGGLIWGLGGAYSLDESDFNRFENANLHSKLGATLNKSLLVELMYGVETREQTEALNTDNPEVSDFEDTPIWHAKLTWSPSELTKLALGYEERFFDTGPTLGFEKRLGNSSIQANFSRNIGRDAARLDDIRQLNNNDADGFDPNNVNVENTDNRVILNEQFVNRQFQLAYKIQGRLSDLLIDSIYTDQESLIDEQKIETLLFRVVFDRQLNRAITLRLQYNYQQSETVDQPELDYEENRFGIKVIYSSTGNDRFNNNLENEL